MSKVACLFGYHDYSEVWTYLTSDTIMKICVNCRKYAVCMGGNEHYNIVREILEETSDHFLVKFAPKFGVGSFKIKKLEGRVLTGRIILCGNKGGISE